MERRDQDRDREKLALISEEAAEWLVRLHDEKLGSAEKLRYARWLKQSPIHIAEMLRIAGLDGYLHENKLKGVVASASESNVIGLPARDVGTRVGPAPSDGKRWSPNRKVATGFSLAAASVMGAVLFNLFGTNSSIDTDVGEWRRVTLSDGSVVNVGPRSHVSFSFDDETRRDVFLTGGEALFQVAKNPNRPFFVSTNLAVVRAVGTQFGVTLRGDRVSVTVKEGKVAVTHGDGARVPSPSKDASSSGSAAGSSVSLVADEQITVTARVWPAKAQRIDASRELAWAQGHLIFDDTTTVAQAAEEFNRRNRVQIVVDDPEIGGRGVCCVFNIDDPESFAQSVATGSRQRDVRLVREGSDTLRLVRTEPSRAE